MAPDLGFVTHATKAHAHEFATGGLGDRLAKRRLANAVRADEAEDRTRELVRAALHREILDDPVLDLVEAVMIGIEHFLARGGDPS